MNIRRIFTSLTTGDAVTVLFLGFFTSLNIIFASRIPQWIILSIVNILLSAGIVASAHFKTASMTAGRNNTAARLNLYLHDWYLVPMILYVYKQTSFLVHPIRQVDYDNTLIAIDRWLFHTDPTRWITQFSHPLITEILQLSYASYYLFFLVLFFELYRRTEKKEFFYGGFLVVFGFYLSYLGYLMVPAVGPRFTLHDFQTLGKELPGLWLTPYLREFINVGGAIPPGVTDPIDYVQRDVFPSGHTQLTLVAMYVGFRTKAMSRWFLLIVGSLLIISTVYMRYHYVIDVIGGSIFFLFTIWSGRRIDAWWQSYKIRYGVGEN